MKKIQILLAAIFVATMSSCSNDVENEQPVSNAKAGKTAKSALINPTIYAFGYGKDSWATQTAATLWTDGVPTNLTDGVNVGSGWSVYKEGTNVYVLTKEYSPSGGPTVSKVFRNNILLYTLPTTGSTHVNSLFVSGGVVYVAGTEFGGPKSIAKLWTNGVATNLTDGINNAEGTSVYVSGGSIYVTGHEQSSGKYIVKLWKKTGTTTTTSTISNTSYNSYAQSVFVVGTDVYIGGKSSTTPSSYENKATIWKNSVATYLTDGLYDASVNSVFVSGTNVYAAGYKYNGTNSAALTWKNSVVTQLSVGSNKAFAYSVFVYGTDIYVGGIEQNPSYSNEPNVAKIWKNGVQYFTTSQGYYHNITSVFVQ
jgi:hypothetical protein